MRKIFLLFLLLSVVSCEKKKTPKPDNLIPKDKMINLLFDMHLANRNRNIKNKFGEKNPNYYPLIYKKYDIDSLQFYQSHSYYMSELTQYKEIYKKLKDSVETLLKKEEKSKKEKDSINRLKKDKKKKNLKKKGLKNIKKLKKEKQKNHRL